MAKYIICAHNPTSSATAYRRSSLSNCWEKWKYHPRYHRLKDILLRWDIGTHNHLYPLRMDTRRRYHLDMSIPNNQHRAMAIRRCQ